MNAAEIDLADLALKVPCGQCNALPMDYCTDEVLHEARFVPLLEAYEAGYSAARWARHP